jgi:hypothetical protein
MKKILTFVLMFISLFSLVVCDGFLFSSDPIDVDLVKTIEAKYDVIVEKVYAGTSIDPDYETENSFKYLTADMKKQLKKVQYEDPCNMAWLGVTYIKTDQGDHLILYVPQIKREKDMEKAVFMIDYPYEYTVDEMKEYLQSLNLFETQAIDFDNFTFSYQYKHNPTMIPQDRLTDRLFQRGCFVSNFSVSITGYLNDDFNPAKDLDSDFVWVLTSYNIEEEVKVSYNQNLWFRVIDTVYYRIFVKDGVVYITMANEDLPESYIYPIEEPVIS